jgi:hypothetical protein
MKRLVFMVLAAMLLVACGPARKAAQKPVKTYVQPGSHLLNQPGVLRAWAVGVSDSEMTAKKKAVASASAQLSQMLNTAVKTTIEDYCVALTDGEAAISKEYLSQKTSLVSEQMLIGAVPIFDEWEAKDAEGMYRNYVVLEISAQDFIKSLFESMADTEAVKATLDMDLLNELFLKAINNPL